VAVLHCCCCCFFAQLTSVYKLPYDTPRDPTHHPSIHPSTSQTPRLRPQSPDSRATPIDTAK
jgi:hypothetical protein